MHPIDIDEAMKTFEIVVDTREQKWKHIENALRQTETPYNRRKLNYGDYSCEVRTSDNSPLSLSERVVIERKANLDELAGNFTKGRARFDREFKRAVDDKAKVFLLIENATWADIEQHHYRSQFPPKSYLATLYSWQAKFNITIIFSKAEQSGNIIKGILWYAMKNYLSKAGDMTC